MLAEEVRRRVGDHRVMRVAGADHPHLVRVVAARLLHGQAVLVGLADVAAVHPRRAVVDPEQEAHDLEVRELVVGRQRGMGLGSPLDLRDLGQRLVGHPLLGPGGIDGSALVVLLHREHDAVAEVGVVGDRQQLVARLALAIHPFPQFLGLVRVDRGKGQ